MITIYYQEACPKGWVENWLKVPSVLKIGAL